MTLEQFPRRTPQKLAETTLWFLSLWLLSISCSVWALDNGLARTPPMGWMAWQRFTCELDCVKNPHSCIDQNLFKAMADRLIEDGWVRLGYEYLSIDDCWSSKQRADQAGGYQLVADPIRFPDGMASLAQYARQRDIKLGLYGDCGLKTCAGYPAQLKSVSNLEDNYFQVDANTLVSWSIESLKFDGCYIDPEEAESICPQMALALNASATRPILLICEWPFYMMYAHSEPDFRVAQEACNVWRYYDDIEDSWASILNTIDYTVKHQSTIVKYHGPGHWFDPDQLVVGNFGLSRNQAEAQMAIWCIWAAPLYMSNDLRELDEHSMGVLKNRHLIGVDQDPLGVFGLMVHELERKHEGLDESVQVFVKPIMPIKNKCPSFALVILNRRELGHQQKVAFNLRDLLAAAPIRQAAKHERLHLGTDQLDTGACLKRFKRQSADPSQDSDSDSDSEGDDTVAPPSRLIYEMIDLLEDGNYLGRISPQDQLELFVEPSGVRAIKLVEVD